MKGKISKRSVDALSPGTKPEWLWDTALSGFGVKVMPSGVKTYAYKYRRPPGGRNAPQRRFTIGKHGSPWTPETARKEAEQIALQVKEGRDPVAERKLDRLNPDPEGHILTDRDTLTTAVGVFIERYAKPRHKRWEETERMFTRDVLPVLGERRLKDLKRQDFVALMDVITAKSPSLANATFAQVRKLLNWCVERGALDISPINGLSEPVRLTV